MRCHYAPENAERRQRDYQLDVALSLELMHPAADDRVIDRVATKKIYRFNNDGSPAYFIGSSDLRSRNLRRRMELPVPVLDRANRELLDKTLDCYLSDSRAWDLAPTGEYLSRGGASSRAQDQFVTDLNRDRGLNQQNSERDQKRSS